MKRALLVATGSDLSSVSDARAMRQLLVTRFGYALSDVKLLHHERNPRDPLYASRRNLEAACSWLVRSARSGDRLFFYFAGHSNADCLQLCGSDAVSAGRLREWIVHPLRATNVRIRIMLDSCQSGGIMPLQFTLSPKLRVDRQRRVRCGCHVRKRHDGTPPRSGPIVIVIAACNADRNAIEVQNVSAPIRRVENYGPATYALRRAVEQSHGPMKYAEFYARMVVKMLQYGQLPRVYCNVSFDPTSVFFNL